MPIERQHVLCQIGTHDADGHRTHQVPGDVCWACSDLDAGRWVPISECPRAYNSAVLDEWPNYAGLPLLPVPDEEPGNDD
jgi:hypothetical protein